MAVVTLDGGQSSSPLGGQVIAYVQQMATQQLPGAPDQLVLSNLGLVLRDFYTRSTGWRDYVNGYAITAGVNAIDLNPVDQNRRIQYVRAAFLFPFENSNQPQPLRPMTREMFGTVPDVPDRFYMATPSLMKLYPTPNANYGNILCVYATIVPTSTLANLPEVAYTHHLDGLLYGLLARMYMMPKKPWSDKQLAMEYQKKYRQEIMLARDFANRGYGPANAPIAIPPFAGRSGSQVLPRAVA